jgi:signal transduction histidine kinase
VRWILAGGALTTMVIGYLMMELAIRISLRPIHKLSEEVRSRTGSPGDVNADLPADLPTELTGIVESFQALLVKVSAIRDRERDFIRHAAHELRTPIAGLRATTDLALSKPRDAATYEEQLKTCRQMAEELSELVKRLTALSRIGNETSKPPLRKLDIRSLLGEQIDRFQALFDERNLKLHSNIDASSPSHVMGNDTLIRLILNNLFDNVYSHAPNGSEAKVGLKRIGDELEISISNPAENLPSDPDRLFEPLFRNEESRHDSSSHLGIGLTLSQEAARSMGCSLSVETTPEGWIKFSFRLPIADS